MNQIQRWSSVVTLAVLAGCGGGGGGNAEVGSAPPPAGAGDPAPSPAPAPAAALPSVSAALATGDYFEYLATKESSDSSAGGGSSTNNSGFLRISLGAPVTVAGVDGFAVTVSAEAEVADMAPKWTFLAVHGSKWQASTDNATLVTLYDPSAATGSSGFFINVPASRTVKVSAGRFMGDYNQLEALALSDGADDGGCSYILGLTVCSDQSTSFSQVEYLLDGVGPIGFSRSSSISFGGSAPGVASSSNKLELVGTSLKPASGVVFKGPPWTGMADLPVPRTNATAAAINGKIYLYGGTSSTADFAATRVDVYDPATDSWTGAPAAPVSLEGWQGTALGALAALFKGADGYLHDPATNTWTALPPRSDANAVRSVSSWSHADGSVDAVVVTTGPTEATYNVWTLVAATQTRTLISNLPATNGSSFSTAMVGDKLYFLGGVGAGIANYVDTATELDLASNTYRSFPGPSGNSSAVAAIGSTVYLLGGLTGTVVANASEIDTTTSTVSALPKFRHARYSAAAAVVAGKIYLMGGYGDKTNEVLASGEIYTP